MNGTASLQIYVLSSVLALRGDHVQLQPLLDDGTGSFLCWNGEAWKVDAATVDGNDSSHIFHLLLQSMRKRYEGTADPVVSVLNKIAGPFAFVFFDGLRRKLYFGRDRLGRRSLLQNQSRTDWIKLCSVPEANNVAWSEVDYSGIYVVDLDVPNLQVELHSWFDAFPPINPQIPRETPLSLEMNSPSVRSLEDQLLGALQFRVADIPSLGGFPNESSDFPYAKVAVLFSGGLDCTVLARLTHEVLSPEEPIDLLNVAFENPRSIAAAQSTRGRNFYEICPDRVTGRQSFSELKAVCRGRDFRFVAIDVPYTESQAHRPHVISLMQPRNTEMDLSIAMALYFASRGRGNIKSNVQEERQISDQMVDTSLYTTTARVLLSGLGADELFAGYTRHATAFSRNSYSGLISELSLDITRLGSRNLGRDDRIISHWSKEARYPYLDEDLVRWTLNLPVWEKCGFGEQRELATNETDHQQKHDEIEPAKKILRLLAKRLGMEGVAKEKKRAIQFGAKTAKMEIGSGKGRTKGTALLT